MKLVHEVLYYINYFRCKKLLYQNRKRQYEYDAVICVIAKNEEQYLKEWIDYHLSIGFQHIYLVDNNDIPGVGELLSVYLNAGVMTLIPFNSIAHPQAQAYEYVALRYGLSSKWMAFIDVDEFFVLFGYSNIVDFLNEYEDIPAIGVNWKMFGANGRIYKTEGRVIDRFPIPSNTSFALAHNNTIKSIVRPLLLIKIYDSSLRYVHRWTLPTFSVHRKRIKAAFSKASYDKIALNHYYTKSYEECKERCSYGDVLMNSVEQKDLLVRFFQVNEKEEMMNDISKYEKSNCKKI